MFFILGRYPSVEISRYLIEHGKADINLRTITGATPLHGAALQGNIGGVCFKLSVSFLVFWTSYYRKINRSHG